MLVVKLSSGLASLAPRAALSACSPFTRPARGKLHLSAVSAAEMNAAHPRWGLDALERRIQDVLCLPHKDFTFQLCFRFPVQGMQADAVNFTGVALVTLVPPGEGTCSSAGSGNVPGTGGCPGCPASLLGDFSTHGELCFQGFNFSISAKLAGWFVGLFACSAGPQPL